jgi:hypothetical protein
MTKNLTAATLFSVAAALAPFAQAQYTGVSHPSDVPVVTSPEGIQQPVVVERQDRNDSPAAAPMARVSAAPQSAAPLRMHTEPDGRVVSDSPPPNSSAFSAYPASSAVVPETRPRHLRKEADGMVVGDDGIVQDETVAGSSVAAGSTSGQTLTERDDSAALRAENSQYLGESARPDVDAQVVTRIEGAANQLPPGTVLRARIRERLSTSETVPGKEFHAELTEPVKRDGRVLLPVGAIITGRVTDVHGGRRISGAASLHLQPLTITMPDGLKYRLQAQVIDSDLYDSTKVDDEGTIIRKDHAGKTLAVMGLTTGAAAATGGLIAGAPGALIGAGVGAGVGTALWLKQDRQTEIPAGTHIVFSLNRAILIGNE